MTAAARRWVCLAYHDVLPSVSGVSGERDFFAVSAGGFEHQLDIIRDANLRGRSIAETIDDPRDAVAISFDDGDIGQAVRAFPALAARNMTATFFVTTSWVGTPSYASWDQLREMRSAGMSIQSHTHTHPFLSELDERHLRDELRRSREMLDEQLGQRTNMLAFPGGDAPRTSLRHVLLDEGYEAVATSQWGRNRSTRQPPPRYVNRCTVRGSPDDATFAALVAGDLWLTLRKQARERVLALVRSSLGPTRYARWRREFLNTVGARR